MEIYTGRKEKLIPKIEFCVISARVGSLASDSLDKWWTLNDLNMSEDHGEDDIIIDEITSRLKKDGIPFLSSFTQEVDVMNYLLADEHRFNPRSSLQCLCLASIIYFLRGDIADYEETLHRASGMSKDTNMQAVVDVIAHRISARRAHLG